MEKMHIEIIWQRFLPYHVARIRHLHKRCTSLGHRLSALEVASQDVSYGFPSKLNNKDFEHICCFPEISYHKLKANEVHRKVLNNLLNLKPDVVFAPATPFPEGMAAYFYRVLANKKAVMMDDAWEYSDRRGVITKTVKRFIQKNIDAVFVPAFSHQAYYLKMGFPRERIVFGVDTVDNDYFAQKAKEARERRIELMQSMQLSKSYFLYVGRFLPRKGIDILINAYQEYKNLLKDRAWDLVFVGGGDLLRNIEGQCKGLSEMHFIGPKFGDDLCHYYGLANTLIVPSEIDPWGLVVNEGMASGLPVIVSRGCGAAKTLVQEGENGWTFEPFDVRSLALLMQRLTLLEPSTLDRMGKVSQEIVRNWSLDRFVDGIMEAISLPRRTTNNYLSRLIIKLWKGRVRVN